MFQLERMQWDINLKLREATSACGCEAEGACVGAGKILDALDKSAEVKSMYERGCDLKYEIACRAAAHPTQRRETSSQPGGMR